MSYFKKFGDFCSGFACFSALIYLFAEYMTFGHKDLGFKDRIVRFFHENIELKNRMMLFLAIMLAISVLASILLKKIPWLTLIFSVPPLVMSVYMVSEKLIEEYPMMYILLCSVSVISGVWECVGRDKADGRHRCAFAGDTVSLMSAGTFMFIWYSGKSIAAEVDTDIPISNAFEMKILGNFEDMSMNLFLVFAGVYAVLTLVSLLLTDVYFIDAILAAVPCAVLIYMWSGGIWTVHAPIVVTFAIVNLGVRIIPAVSAGRKQNG